ncbi:MAG: hypothetical protein WBO46_03745 [Caldilineaceae bacterium]
MNFPVIPARMALINVDMQNIFVDRLQDDELALLECINGFAAVCREAGILVIHTREIIRGDASKAGVMGEILPNVPERFNIDALIWWWMCMTSFWINRAMAHSMPPTWS